MQWPEGHTGGGGQSPGHMGQESVGVFGAGSAHHIMSAPQSSGGGHCGGGGQFWAAAKPNKSVKSRNLIFVRNQVMDS